VRFVEHPIEEMHLYYKDLARAGMPPLVHGEWCRLRKSFTRCFHMPDEIVAQTVAALHSNSEKQTAYQNVWFALAGPTSARNIWLKIRESKAKLEIIEFSRPLYALAKEYSFLTVNTRHARVLNFIFCIFWWLINFSILAAP
jgi:hypothetical protein